MKSPIIAFVLDPETRAELVAEAGKHQRTLSQLCRIIVKKWLAEQKFINTTELEVPYVVDENIGNKP
jgi:hypothetical protein